MPASTRSRRWRTSISPRRCRRRRCVRRINDELPADINILRVEKVRHTFHARHDARGAQLHLPGRPAADGVRQAVRLVGQGRSRPRRACATPPHGFVGFHDFRSFSDDDPQREIDDGAARRASRSTRTATLVLFRVEGSHFLWKMVRRLVGVLVEVGRGGLTPDEAVAMLSADSDCRRG